jgi:hypothetical protein
MKKGKPQTSTKPDIRFLGLSRIMAKDGYIYIRTEGHPNSSKGYVPEHRLVVERMIQRFLRPGEVVHHLDNDRANNEINNLMLFKNAKEHAKFHNKIKRTGYTKDVIDQINRRWEEQKCK